MPGSKKGEHRGGRKKGTPNRLSQDVSAKLKRLGCDPITGMVNLIKDVNTDLTIKARLYTELAQYVYPKRKAIDPDEAIPWPQAQAMMQQYMQLFQMVILRHVNDSTLTAAIFSDFAQGMGRLTPPGAANGASMDNP